MQGFLWQNNSLPYPFGMLWTVSTRMYLTQCVCVHVCVVICMFICVFVLYIFRRQEKCRADSLELRTTLFLGPWWSSLVRMPFTIFAIPLFSSVTTESFWAFLLPIQFASNMLTYGMTHSSSTREVFFSHFTDWEWKLHAQGEEGDLPKVTELGGTWNSTLFRLTPKPRFAVLHYLT